MALFDRPEKAAHLDNVVQTLPSYQEIIELLLRVDSAEYYKDNFYPIIAKHAGKDVTPSALIAIIKTSITEFCATKPMGRALEILLLQKAQRFANVLVDDLFFQEGLQKLFANE